MKLEEKNIRVGEQTPAVKFPLSSQADALQCKNGGNGVFVHVEPEGSTDEQSPTSIALTRSADASQKAT